MRSFNEYDDRIQSYLKQIKSVTPIKLKSTTDRILDEYCKLLEPFLIRPLYSYPIAEFEKHIVTLRKWRDDFKNKSLSIIKNTRKNEVPFILIRPAYTTFISSMDKIIKDIEFVKDNQYKNSKIK